MSSAEAPHTPLAGTRKPFLEDVSSNQGLGKVFWFFVFFSLSVFAFCFVKEI